MSAFQSVYVLCINNGDNNPLCFFHEIFERKIFCTSVQFPGISISKFIAFLEISTYEISDTRFSSASSMDIVVIYYISNVFL